MDSKSFEVPFGEYGLAFSIIVLILFLSFLTIPSTDRRITTGHVSITRTLESNINDGQEIMCENKTAILVTNTETNENQGLDDGSDMKGEEFDIEEISSLGDSPLNDACPISNTNTL